jgi:hypothetical protein
MKVKKYLLNCFLLLIPILVWNIVFTPYLPEKFSPDIFWDNIPTWITIGENTFRIAVMIIPAILILSLKETVERIGFSIYLFGAIIYFISWLILILYPASNWSQSIWGFIAPAYTPIVWLIGISLIGHKSFLPIKNISVIYILLSILFIIFHSLHAFIVYERH